VGVPEQTTGCNAGWRQWWISKGWWYIVGLQQNVGAGVDASSLADLHRIFLSSASMSTGGRSDAAWFKHWKDVVSSSGGSAVAGRCRKSSRRLRRTLAMSASMLVQPGVTEAGVVELEEETRGPEGDSAGNGGAW